MSGLCIDCGTRIESFEGLSECPTCKSKSVPCSDKLQVDISINWHELRVLIMWAENWSLKNSGNAGVIYGIAERIRLQHPEIKTPLTIASEINAIKDEFGHDNVETNFPTE